LIHFEVCLICISSSFSLKILICHLSLVPKGILWTLVLAIRIFSIQMGKKKL
jgi:hypothetical protein